MTTKPQIPLGQMADDKPDQGLDDKHDQKPDDSPDHRPDEKPGTGRSVTFAIDGVAHTTDKPRQAAADLLRLAGVDPTDHELGRVDPRGKVTRIPDDEEVDIAPGDRFVTIFTGTTPIV